VKILTNLQKIVLCENI